ncbi:AtpZ/AtpI family protein [Bacillus taeanensis]|uniref:AtpZ/AtpI family protein n=1 Tax=Bacillus taeanensis TaxID=273032 RepID=UPI0026B71728
MKQAKPPLYAMALMSGILGQLAGATICGVFLGKWLDNLFQTAPLCLILGLFLGLGTGIFGMMTLIRKYSGEER